MPARSTSIHNNRWSLLDEVFPSHAQPASGLWLTSYCCVGGKFWRESTRSNAFGSEVRRCFIFQKKLFCTMSLCLFRYSASWIFDRLLVQNYFPNSDDQRLLVERTYELHHRLEGRFGKQEGSQTTNFVTEIFFQKSWRLSWIVFQNTQESYQFSNMKVAEFTRAVI